MISIYIPRVNINVSLEQVKNIFENIFNIGTIIRIERRSNRRSESYYYYCYIFFSKWNVNDIANNILECLNCNQPTRISHETADLWIFNNTSELSFFCDPIHMDLTIELFSGIKHDTILSIIDSLDIGKVYSIEIINSNKIDNHSMTNMITIHFQYWYRTKATYVFQTKIINDKYIEIDINHVTNRIDARKLNKYVWTFYPASPNYHGINPNIWSIPKDNAINEVNVIENYDDNNISI